jgi:SAM-dependent methyltransferase
MRPAKQTGKNRGLAPVMINQLARYEAVVSLVAEKSPSSVLEVGSGSAGLARFAEGRYSITACDRDFSDYGTTEVDASPRDLRRVEADVTELPFEDRAFDVVVALDLMEHVPLGERETALTELARVSRVRAIVGCPCGQAALESDRRLAEYYDRMPRCDRPAWLVEHLENGFPETRELVDPLSQFGEVRLVGNENIRAHQMVARIEAVPLVMRATLLLAALLKPALTNERAGSRAFVIQALRGFDRTPVYRQIAVLDRSFMAPGQDVLAGAR